jgi:PmbA protein
VDETEKTSLPELVQSTERGLLINNLMGMHTQDSTSGRYSVSAPQSLVINQGEIIGTVKTTLNGNFFENLNDEKLRFGWDPREDNPAVKIFCNISGTE